MSWLKALLAALLFGASTPLSKQLLHQVHPFLLAALFYLGAALILLPTAVYYQVKTPVRNISRSDFFHLTGSLFFGGMVGPVLLLSLRWKGMTRWGALAGMLAGTTSTIVWKNTAGLNDLLDIKLATFLIALAAAWTVARLTAGDRRV